MKTTPQQFANLLAHSSLSESERQAVLQILPTLDQKQIEEVAKVLTADSKAKKKFCAEIKKKQEEIQAEFVSDLDKAELAAVAEEEF